VGRGTRAGCFFSVVGAVVGTVFFVGVTTVSSTGVLGRGLFGGVCSRGETEGFCVCCCCCSWSSEVGMEGGIR